MRRDVHLDIGTKVINTKTGDLGEVAEPFYMARPDIHEICIQWDKWKGTERTECIDRADIEYKGNGEYERALKRFGHAT